MIEAVRDRGIDRSVRGLDGGDSRGAILEYEGPVSLGVGGAEGLAGFESTQEAGEVWSGYLAMVADATLFGRTDSWYVAANVPGKRRQLLDLPLSDACLERLAECAAEG